MPFYEYQCRSCGKLTEVLQKVSDPPLKKCPECGKSQLVKLISAPVFRLKGGGWYETDFKSDGENKRNLVGDKEEPKPAEAAKPEEAKTETKPAEKAAEPAAKPVATTKPAARSVKKAPAKAKRAVSKRR